MKIYFDLDGVLADFKRGYELAFPNSDINDIFEMENNKKIFSEIKFYETLPIIQKGIDFLLKCRDEGFDVGIITKVDEKDYSLNSWQKKNWVKKNIPFDISFVSVKHNNQKTIFANSDSIIIENINNEIDIKINNVRVNIMEIKQKTLMDFNEFKEEFLNEKLITFGKIAYPKFNNVVILAGGAGSGKSFVSSNLIGIEGLKFDSDRLKELAIATTKFAETVKQKTGIDIKNFDYTDPENTSKIRDILYDLGTDKQFRDKKLKGVLSADLDKKPNLIFDVTLSNLRNFKRVINDVISVGYKKEDIHIVWILNDILIALKQNKTRSRRVSDEGLIDTHIGASKTMLTIIEMDNELKQYMDGDIIVSFNRIGVDSKVVKSEFGGQYVEDSDYFYVKRKGESPIKFKELPAEIKDKIVNIVPRTSLPT